MNSKSISHIKSLDGLRAIAALMVMFFHFFQNLTFSDTTFSIIKKISSFGQTGVSLFFVLSGFLITRILIRDKTNDNYLLNFYLRRSLRIFPLYYLYLALIFFIIPLVEGSNIPDFSKQIYHWVYLQDFAITFEWSHAGPLHFWSLAVEEHFYLFFPLLVYYLKENQLVIALFGIMLSSILMRIILNHYNYEVFYFTFTRMDELAFGGYLAVLEMKKKLTPENSKKFIYLLVVTILPLIVLWIIFSSQANTVMQVVKFTLIGLFYFGIIGFFVSVRHNHILNSFLTSNFLTFTGKISYGLYVYHGLCFESLNSLYQIDNIYLKMLVSFIFAYLVSIISFYLFESWFLKFKNVYSKR